QDIAPLIYSNCTTCHREGETAPFSLITYQEVQKRAKQIVDVTSRHYMPPWKAEPGTNGHDFLGQRHLSDDQINLLKLWSEQGTPQGDPTQVPSPPQFSSGWQLGQPDLIVKMSEPYTVPAEGRDIYRCFVIPVQIQPGKYVRAAEYRPQNRRVVHHAVLS